MALAVKARPTGRLLFGSDGEQPTVVLPAVAANLSLPSVTIPADAIPSGAVIRRVTAGISFRKGVESSAALNAVAGDQEIQVRIDTPGTFINAIHIEDNTLSHAASSTEGGVLIMGSDDVSSEVSVVNATYEFQWTLAVVDGASITLHDVQTYLLVEYD